MPWRSKRISDPGLSSCKSSYRQLGPISLSSCLQEQSISHPLLKDGPLAYTVCWRQCSPSWTEVFTAVLKVA